MHPPTSSFIPSGLRTNAHHAICFFLLWVTVASAHAASVYKCVDAQGHLAYRDTPCAARAHELKLDLQPQPLIGAPGEHAARVVAQSRPRGVPHSRAQTRQPAHPKALTSWECQAADGEVFYRHTRCPGSVPGDGTVRNDHVAETKHSRKHSRQGAWGRVSVHGKKISRAEACQRIHAAGAAGRDGHTRDETVSTYDHLMGRDPCGA